MFVSEESIVIDSEELVENQLIKKGKSPKSNYHNQLECSSWIPHRKLPVATNDSVGRHRSEVSSLTEIN